MTEMIQRSLVDLALTNLSKGLGESLNKLTNSINSTWNELTDARKAAKKNRDSLYDAADSNRKKKRDAAIAAYNAKSGKPGGPTFESHQQKLASIDDTCDREKAHADELFNRDCTAAENEFRSNTKEYRELFTKDVNTVLETFESAHP